MQRKEVVVAGRVFDLGIDDFAAAIDNKEGKLPVMELDVDGRIFQLGVVKRERALALHWCGMTNLANITWMRFVFIRFRWPVVRSVSLFTMAGRGNG